MINETLWNSPEEAVGSFFLGGITIFIYAYGTFLSYAISDYQDEKPPAEKRDHNILRSHLMGSEIQGNRRLTFKDD